MAKTTAFKNEKGENVYVGEGAQAQDGRLKLYTCNTCQREVVWATSKRTGKVYLVNVQRGYNDQRFYMKNVPHRCEDVLASRSITTEFEDLRVDNLQLLSHLRQALLAGDEALTAEIEAKLDANADRMEQLRKA